MIKKILSVLLGLLSVVFLGVGIVYSSCPVVPFAKYTLYDENGELAFFDANLSFDLKNPTKNCLSFVTFTPNGKIKTHHKYERYALVNRERKHLSYETVLLQLGVYLSNENVLIVTTFSPEISYSYNLSAYSMEISNSKKTLTKKDGSYLQTKFNPTFIFYLVSVFSLAGLIGINYKWILEKIKKMKPEENE